MTTIQCPRCNSRDTAADGPIGHHSENRCRDCGYLWPTPECDHSAQVRDPCGRDFCATCHELVRDVYDIPADDLVDDTERVTQ